MIAFHIWKYIIREKYSRTMDKLKTAKKYKSPMKNPEGEGTFLDTNSRANVTSLALQLLVIIYL